MGQDRKTLVIFPNRLLLEEALLGNQPVLFYENWITFHELIARLYAELPHRKAFLNKQGVKLLLQQVVIQFDRETKDHFFSAISSKPGFLRHLGAFVSDCNKALLTPDQLKACTQMLDGDDRERLHTLARLYERYQKAKQQQNPPLADSDDVEAELAEALQKDRFQPRLIEPYEVLDFQHLFHLTPLRFELLEGLALAMERKGGRVSLSVVYDPQEQEGVFAFSSYTLTDIERLGAQCQAVDDPAFLDLEDLKRPAPLQDLLKGLVKKFPTNYQLFTGKRDGENDRKHVEFIEARGRYEEVEEVARRIRQLLDSGEAAHDILVIARNLENYGDLIEDVFRRYHIPLWYRRGSPLSSAPVIRALLAVFDFLEEPLSKDALLRVMRSGYKPSFPKELYKLLSHCPIFGEEKDFEYARKQWIEAIPQAFLSLQKTNNKESASWLKDPGIEFYQQIVQNLFEQLASLAESVSVAEHINCFRKLLKDWKVRDHTTDEDPGQLKRDRKALQRLHELLDELQRYAEATNANEPISLRFFSELLREILQELTIPQQNPYQGVRVLSCEDVVGLEGKIVFLIGLTAKDFPQPCYESALLPDRIKSLINKEIREKRRGQDRTRRAFFTRPALYLREAFFFFASVLAARKKLYLCRHLLDEQERLLSASPYYRSAEALLGRKESRLKPAFTSAPPLEDCLTESELFARLAINLGSTGLEENCRKLTAAYYRAAQQKESRRGKLERLIQIAKTERERLLFFTGQKISSSTQACGQLLSPAAKAWVKHFATSHALPPTELEDYGLCPFKFFSLHLLDIGRVEPPGDELDPRAEGSLYHEVMKTYLQQKKEKNLPIWLNGDEERLIQIIQETCRRWKEKNFTASRPFLFELKVEAIKRQLLAFFKHLEEWSEAKGIPLQKLYCLDEEVTFGLEGSQIQPELTVRSDGQDLKVRLSGRMDALLCADTNIFVVDFKAKKNAKDLRTRIHSDGEPKENFQNIGKTGWQLPVYCLAAEEENQDKEIQAAYWALKAVKKNALALSFPWNEQRKALFLKNASLTIGDLASGKFAIEPYAVEESCRSCELKRICRHPEAVASSFHAL